jgi:hypothetical protein
MTIGRRGFLLAGGVVAGAGVLPEAMAAPVAVGRSVTDFGVEPNSDADQSKALQTAIDEISKSGQAVYIPGGSYRGKGLQLPQRCAIIGDPGQTVLRFPSNFPILGTVGNQSLYLSGLTFDGSLEPIRTMDVVSPSLYIDGGEVSLSHCVMSFENGGMAILNASGVISSVSLRGCGIFIQDPRGMAVNQCRIDGFKGAFGIEVVRKKPAREGVLLSNNHISQCGGGIGLQGGGVVNANFVFGAQDMGLKLGSAKSAGGIIAQGNVMQDCRIGIGVSASGDDIFASLNMIKGAKDGAIRVFDGDKLVGSDLAQKSAESYLNLTVAGNVVR